MKKLNALLKETKNAFSDFVKEYDFSLQENVSPTHIENDFNLFLSDNEYKYFTLLELFEKATLSERESLYKEMRKIIKKY